jgi:hypothetical protein
MIESIRQELAERVLPALDDDRARSSVIAMLGILRNLAVQIREDDAWIDDALAVLEPGCVRWRSALPADAPISLPEPAGAGAQSPKERREELLAACEELVTYLWREQTAPTVLADIRAVLRADLELQLARSR